MNVHRKKTVNLEDFVIYDDLTILDDVLIEENVLSDLIKYCSKKRKHYDNLTEPVPNSIAGTDLETHFHEIANQLSACTRVTEKRKIGDLEYMYCTVPTKWLLNIPLHLMFKFPAAVIKPQQA